ncbi:DUF898 family protein [Mangrovibacter sp. SLW1]
MSDVNDGMVNSPVRAMSFKGTGGEFFVIWLVNAILTIITLGLFLPGPLFVHAVISMKIQN